MLTQQKNAFIHLSTHPISIHSLIHLFSHHILSSYYVIGTECKKMKEKDTLSRRHCLESGRDKTLIIRLYVRRLQMMLWEQWKGMPSSERKGVGALKSSWIVLKDKQELLG